MKKNIEEIKKVVKWLEDKSPRERVTYEAGYVSHHRKTLYNPTKGGDGGDDILWLGLLATVGDKDAIEAIDRCQKESGQFFRSPERALNNNYPYKWYFSRDMAMGVLCWLASGNGTKYNADLWIKYIMKLKPRCIKKKPKWLGGGCLLRSPMKRYAPDNDGRSDITPSMWALMGRVWRFRGWKETRLMKKYKYMDGDVSCLSAIINDSYQLHLCAVGAYIKRIIGQSKAYADEVSKICADKERLNIFYSLIEEEVDLSFEAETFLAFAPSPTKPFIPRDYWLWEKQYINSAINKGKYCGWDWIFVGKLIIKMYELKQKPR